MHRIHYLKAIFLIAIICSPDLLLATRGSKDYGILLVVMFMIYSFPVGILLFCFLIYTLIKLKNTNKPTKGQGKVIFIISIIIIFPTILIPLAIMSGENWDPQVVELMLGAFMPILIMAIATTVLAKIIKNRSLLGENEPE